MGKTTKSGKREMNPTDAFRKEQRKKEIKKNKKDRKRVRELGSYVKDPEIMKKELDKMEKMQQNGTLDHKLMGKFDQLKQLYPSIVKLHNKKKSMFSRGGALDDEELEAMLDEVEEGEISREEKGGSYKGAQDGYKQPLPPPPLPRPILGPPIPLPPGTTPYPPRPPAGPPPQIGTATGGLIPRPPPGPPPGFPPQGVPRPLPGLPPGAQGIPRPPPGLPPHLVDAAASAGGVGGPRPPGPPPGPPPSSIAAAGGTGTLASSAPPRPPPPPPPTGPLLPTPPMPPTTSSHAAGRRPPPPPPPPSHYPPGATAAAARGPPPQVQRRQAYADPLDPSASNYGEYRQMSYVEHSRGSEGPVRTEPSPGRMAGPALPPPQPYHLHHLPRPGLPLMQSPPHRPPPPLSEGPELGPVMGPSKPPVAKELVAFMPASLRVKRPSAPPASMIPRSIGDPSKGSNVVAAPGIAKGSKAATATPASTTASVNDSYDEFMKELKGIM